MILVVAEHGMEDVDREVRARAVNQALGDAIDAIREELTDLNQRDFAELIGMKFETYSKYRRDRHTWTVPMLVEVARALGLDPASILVRADLSATATDPVSALSQDPLLEARERGALIFLVRQFRDRRQPGA